MKSSVLKDKLTQAIKEIDDEAFLLNIYNIINDAKLTNNLDFELSEQEWKVIEERQKDFLSGKAKTISISKIRERFNQKFPS